MGLNSSIALREWKGLLVLVWLHGEADPEPVEWDSHMDQIEREMHRTGTPHEEVRALVVTDGGAPGLQQRSAMNRLLRETKWAVITDVLSNPLKRGVATALQWVNPAMLFVKPTEGPRAFAHLGLTEAVPQLWQDALTLQRQMPKIRVLGALATSLQQPTPEVFLRQSQP